MLSTDPGIPPSFMKQIARPSEDAIETHPSIEALKQIIDKPELHTVGALAELADNLLAELSLFSALCGATPAMQAEPAVEHLAADVELDFIAAFLRDLDELDQVRVK
jgi:hypothetical protein